MSNTFRLKSYVPRGRRTLAQEKAYAEYWPKVGLTLENGQIDYHAIFGSQAPCFLEIGFGSGISLLALAKAYPQYHFIGVETHQPGIGALCMGIKEHQLPNLRIFYQDAIDVLGQGIPDASLDGVQIFFPDPWPKRRHHQRRLIQAEFIKLVTAKIKPGGRLHLATDWEDYAKHMLIILTAEPQLQNTAVGQGYAERSTQRPILTKFESRAQREGRVIRDLQFKKI